MQRDVYVHRQAELPYTFGRDILRDHPEVLLSGGVAGEARHLDLQAQVGPVHLTRPVAVDFGDFREKSDGLCYRDLSWEAVRGAEFFPVMEGEFELSELSSGRVQVSFIGWYRPPLSMVGAAIDAAALHLVAERSVEALLDDAVAALEEAWVEEPRSAAHIPSL